MKFGLSDEVNNKILDIVRKYDKYTFKIFGSRAKNTYKDRSDIDIAIFKDVPIDIQYKIMNDFDLLDVVYKIDLIFINKNTKKEILNEIEKEGIVLEWRDLKKEKKT